MLTGKLFDRLGKAARIIKRGNNLQSCSRRGRGVVVEHKGVVLLAMPRRDMHTACPLVQGHEITEQDRRESFRQRSPALQHPKAVDGIASPFDGKNRVPG